MDLKQFHKVFCNRLFTLTLKFFFARVKLEIYTTLNSRHPCSLVIHCFYHLRSLTRKKVTLYPFKLFCSRSAVQVFHFELYFFMFTWEAFSRPNRYTVKNPFGSSDHDGRLLGLIFCKVINPVFGSQRTTLHLKCSKTLEHLNWMKSSLMPNLNIMYDVTIPVT